MSTTLHFLALNEENLALYLAAQKAETEFWEFIGRAKESDKIDHDAFDAVDEPYGRTGEAWYAARVAMGRGEQLPILEASHRDTEPCELTALFVAGEDFTLTVTDSNIEEIADAWEDSDRKRTFSMGRGKGTVYGWLLEHRGQTITLGS